MSQLRRGQRYRGPDRHRRLCVSAVVLASVVVVGGITGASGGLSSSGPHRGGPLPSPQPRPTPTVPAPSYDPTPITPAEVLRRCENQLKSWPDISIATASDWQLDTATAPSDTLRVGAQVTVSAPGVSATCTIAQADWAAIGSGPTGIPLQLSEASGAVRRQCSRVAGYDFSAWAVPTAMAAADGFAAVLRSSNDYVATCELGPLWDGMEAQWVTILGPSDGSLAPYLVELHSLRRAGPELRRTDWGTVYTGAGRLYDAAGRPAVDGAAVRLELPDGSVVARPVVDATYALRAFHAGAPVDGTVSVTVLDAEGRPLAQYDTGAGQR